jgi:HEPN domain-containing protein
MTNVANLIAAFKPNTMNTSLKHLSSLQRGQLETAKRIIIQAVRPEKIILFGVYSVAAEAAIFNEKLLPGIGAYDLLVVTREGDHRSDYELQDIIENRCRDEVPVTVLVHDIGYVNKRMAEGHYFFSTILGDAILLFDGGGTRLAGAGMSDLAQVRLRAEKDFERWRRQAWAFFRSAEFNIGREEWKIATFLLHQAAEHMYQAILLAFTGYKPTTHNLDKLRRYTNRFSIELALLFPRNSEEEDRIFRQLLSGYVDARYKEDFSVTGEEAGLLTERVGRLLEIAERVCRNRLLSLEKKVASL